MDPVGMQYISGWQPVPCAVCATVTSSQDVAVPSPDCTKSRVTVPVGSSRWQWVAANRSGSGVWRPSSCGLSLRSAAMGQALPALLDLQQRQLSLNSTEWAPTTHSTITIIPLDLTTTISPSVDRFPDCAPSDIRHLPFDSFTRLVADHV